MLKYLLININYGEGEAIIEIGFLLEELRITAKKKKLSMQFHIYQLKAHEDLQSVMFSSNSSTTISHEYWILLHYTREAHKI